MTPCGALPGQATEGRGCLPVRLLPVVIALLLSTRTAPAQNDSNTSQSPPAETAIALHDYESCTFDDGLQIVKIDSLPKGLQQRTVDTAQGPKVIQMLAGRRIMLAYGVGGDRFANVKTGAAPGRYMGDRETEFAR